MLTRDKFLLVEYKVKHEKWDRKFGLCVKGFHLLFVYVKMKIIKWIIRPLETKIK